MMTLDELRTEMRKESPHRDAMATVLEACKNHGPSYASVAKALHVQSSTVSRWTERHPSVAQALQRAEEDAELAKTAERQALIDQASAEVAKAKEALRTTHLDLFKRYADMDYLEVKRTEEACQKAIEPLQAAKKKLSTLKSAERARQRRIEEKINQGPKETEHGDDVQTNTRRAGVIPAQATLPQRR